jgi:hypothetical protein
MGYIWSNAWDGVFLSSINVTYGPVLFFFFRTQMFIMKENKNIDVVSSIAAIEQSMPQSPCLET